MERKPTENGEAYLAFVQAHNVSCALEDFEKLKQSEQLYQRAIELDPNFALAIARYSQLESLILHSLRTDSGTPRKKRRPWPRRLCNCSPICPKRIWLADFRITTATTITTQR
jgi:hypothetical protein